MTKPEHCLILDFGKTMLNLSPIYRLQGRYPEAERIYKQILQINNQEINLRPVHIAANINATYGLALVGEAQDRQRKAEPLSKHFFQQCGKA